MAKTNDYECSLSANVYFMRAPEGGGRVVKYKEMTWVVCTSGKNFFEFRSF